MLSAISALSGMQAASLRMTATANNVANISSNGALPNSLQAASPNAPKAYQPVRVEQSSGPSGGTVATVRNVNPSYVPMFDPTAGYADSQGMVAAPNVDLANEMVNLVSAKQEFTANAKVAQSINDLVQKLFDLTDHANG
jgi:flagellar basal-body rod protein FlgC